MIAYLCKLLELVHRKEVEPSSLNKRMQKIFKQHHFEDKNISSAGKFLWLNRTTFFQISLFF